MKAVILAGGFGTRLSEETHLRPKPMVEIGGMPIIYHIMNYLDKFGIKDFIVCCGYKSEIIKDYFVNFHVRNSDVQIDLATGTVEVLQKNSRDWNVTLVDTGLDAMTGGRLLSVKKFVGNAPFLFTYGDGLCDVDINKLQECHLESGKMATVTAVSPPGRFGALDIQADGAVNEFIEKPKGDGSRINGGYFILEPQVFEFIDGPSISWEEEPLREIANSGQLNAYVHDGNWIAMDTLRDKQNLEKLWTSKQNFW